MSDPQTLLALFFGMVAGFSLGWVSAWRFARKLEHHAVALWKWERPIDWQAAQPGELKPFERTVSR